MEKSYVFNKAYRSVYKKLLKQLEKNMDSDKAQSIMLLISAIAYGAGCYALLSSYEKEVDEYSNKWTIDSSDLVKKVRKMNEFNKKYFERKTFTEQERKEWDELKSINIAEWRAKHNRPAVSNHKSKQESLMKRMPSEEEWNELQTRLKNGEKYTDILNDLGLD